MAFAAAIAGPLIWIRERAAKDACYASCTIIFRGWRHGCDAVCGAALSVYWRRHLSKNRAGITVYWILSEALRISRCDGEDRGDDEDFPNIYLHFILLVVLAVSEFASFLMTSNRLDNDRKPNA